jgi:hypothetical protein
MLRIDHLVLGGGGLRVTISARDGGPEDLRGELEDDLRSALGARAAGHAALTASERVLPATADGRDAEFRLVAGGGRWVAMLGGRRRRYVVTVAGAGEPPRRLDIVAVGPDDVETRF